MTDSLTPLTSPSAVKAVLQELQMVPGKSMGQNFLIDRNILNIFVDLAELKKSDSVMEIGPGLGTVTRELLARAGRVTAIEKDLRLCDYLRQTLSACSNLELMAEDALEAPLEGMLAGGCGKLVSNLPYSCGTRILVRVITAPARPELVVVTVQRDVAERMTAGPSCKAYGLLSVCVQTFYEAVVERVVSHGCFYPRPRVDSAIVRLRRRPEPLTGGLQPDFILRLLHEFFSKRRKQLGTLLSQIMPARGMKKEDMESLLVELGLDHQMRPENLSPAQWAELLQALAARG